MSGRVIPVRGNWPRNPLLKFGARRSYEKHQGVDLEAPVGTPVLAAADGRVVLVVEGYRPAWRGYGRVVVISHGGSRWTLYAHLSRADVQPGMLVRAGNLIGAVGRTKWTTPAMEEFSESRPHVHFEVLTRYVPRPRSDRFTIMDRTDPKTWVERSPATGVLVGGAVMLAAVLL